jgi:hypothetical protein
MEQVNRYRMRLMYTRPKVNGWLLAGVVLAFVLGAPFAILRLSSPPTVHEDLRVGALVRSIEGTAGPHLSVAVTNVGDRVMVVYGYVEESKDGHWRGIPGRTYWGQGGAVFPGASVTIAVPEPTHSPRLRVRVTGTPIASRMQAGVLRARRWVETHTGRPQETPIVYYQGTSGLVLLDLQRESSVCTSELEREHPQQFRQADLTPTFRLISVNHDDSRGKLAE